MAEKVVIQCCSGKKRRFWIHDDGKQVMFVAHPDLCTSSDEFVFCMPDKTWRQLLEEYNHSYKQTGKNFRGLCKAWELYQPNPRINLIPEEFRKYVVDYKQIYKNLRKKYHEENLFILSAGWGLVRSDFLLPYYDITLNKQADEYKKRKHNDRFCDFNHLDENVEQNDTVYFFGGNDYLPLYYSLTRDILCEKKVIYHYSLSVIEEEGYGYEPFREGGTTIWFYERARRFISEDP